MVDHVDRRKQNTVVAVLTYISGLNVRGILAGRLCTVVATYTIASDIDVIEIGRQPAIRRMTIIAGITTCNVGWVFARRNRAVVTR